MRIENWCGYDIRFVEINGEWYAILKDICDALKLHTFKVSQRLDPRMMEKVSVEVSDMPLRYNRSKGENKTRQMLAINEEGIYQALFASRKLEARKFQLWTFDVLKKLRKSVGLEGYEVMRMTESNIQEDLNGQHSDVYGNGYIWQAGFVQGSDGFWHCGHFYGR